jgi:hydroxymethylbilane synthase
MPPPLNVRVATRGSQLSLAQSAYVISLLRARFPSLQSELVTVVTYGDRHRDIPLAKLQAPDGVFTRGVEAELLTGRAEVAVHSLKDLPTTTDASLELAAFPPRADVRDALVSRWPGGFDQLPTGALLGTSSPRRAAQALTQRPDLRVVSIRGNVDTRLRKLRSEQVDALLLAAAGLERLKRLHEVSEYLPLDQFTPAVGQGALAVQCRLDDDGTRQLLASIDDPATRAAVTAERTFLRVAGGGCRLPLAAYGEVNNGRLSLRGFIANPDGTGARTGFLDGPVEQPDALGLALGRQLMARTDRGSMVKGSR